jgi:hexosaminidase
MVGEHVNHEPSVMPTLHRWQGGVGRWHFTHESRIVMEPGSASTLRPLANKLAYDVAEISGTHPAVVIADVAHKGDIALSLAPCGDKANQEIGGEGYTLRVGQAALLRANTVNGVFYATRTLLQMMTMDGQASGAHRSALRGYTLDFPRYDERAVMFDVGRKFASVAFLENYIRFMGWYKLNTLHLHLNDQVGVKGQNTWLSRSFRLKSDNPAFRNLIPADGEYYTRHDWNRLEAVAAANAVHIVPEIDTPGHAGAFVIARPDLAYKMGSPRGGVLDPTEPATLAYIESVWAQFLPWFHSRVVHIGGDEVNSGNGGSVSIAEQVNYQNRLGQFLEAHGKSVEVWGNTIKFVGALDHSFVIQRWHTWNSADPVNWGKAGFEWTQSSDTWYIVPTEYGLQGGSAALYEDWNHDPENNPGPYAPRGGQICVWNDHGNRDYNYRDTINVLLKDVIPAAGQTFWRGKARADDGHVVSYALLQTRAKTLQYGPEVIMFKNDPL